MRNLLLTSLLLGLLPSAIAKADDQSAARAILDKAILAHGGEAALGKYVGVHCKAKLAMYADGQVRAATFEYYFQRPDKERSTLAFEGSKTGYVKVLNGKNGWTKRGESETQTMTEALVAEWQESNYKSRVNQLFPLKSSEFQLSPVDEISVESRPAVGILVRCANHEALKLYFDKESHLEVMIKRRTMKVGLGREVVEEIVMSDYKVIQGAKHALKTTSYEDGVKVWDSTITSVELSEKPLDEKLFAKP